MGLSTVFLNSSLQPQREQGSWSLSIGSTASSWCLRQRHTVNIHCAVHSVPLRVAKKVIRRCLSKPIGPTTPQGRGPAHDIYFLSQRLCTAAASSGSGSAAKGRPIPKCSIATLSTVSLPLHGTMMQIFRPSDGDRP